jgi:uncharacterized membrane protein (DUF373 family)
MVELINTDIRFLRGAGVDVAVFVEVALVVVVREIIMLPAQEMKPDWIEVGMWVTAAALLGLTYVLVRYGQRLLKLGFTSEGETESR